jgi:hypothetical protein
MPQVVSKPETTGFRVNLPVGPGNIASWLLTALFALAMPCERGRAQDWLNLGPVVDDFPLALAPGHRTEALGPFFYSEQMEAQETWAVPPLLSHTVDRATDFSEVDFLYPLMTYRRFGTEYRWQFLQIFSFAGGHDQEERASRRLTLFPVYFHQRSADSNRNYTAVFPFYGHLQNRVLRQEISFVMFPFYGQSRKRGVVTDNYLFPLFHRRHGDGVSGWQFWPLLGREHRDAAIGTNGFGDFTVTSGYDERFLLWPVYFNRWSNLGTENPQRELALLPFFDWQRSPRRDSTSVLWPLFTRVNDRENQYVEWQMPWPLIVFARGEGKNTSRIWPFFSHAQNTNLESAFYLWPIYRYKRMHADALDRERTRILFFLYSDIRQRNTETGAAERRIDCLPLFTHRRGLDGSTRLQIFSPLEPFLPFSKSIERNYSPLWSLWREEHNPGTGAASQSLLWNLYRRDVTRESTKCSLLLGLFQYQSGSEGKRLRLFFIPVIKTRPAPPLQPR